MRIRQAESGHFLIQRFSFYLDTIIVYFVCSITKPEILIKNNKREIFSFLGLVFVLFGLVFFYRECFQNIELTNYKSFTFALSQWRWKFSSFEILFHFQIILTQTDILTMKWKSVIHCAPLTVIQLGKCMQPSKVLQLREKSQIGLKQGKRQR